jgi:LEA14-like dessication related protein
MARVPLRLSTLLFLSALLLGCQQAQELLRGLNKPSVRVADLRLSDISLEAATLAVDLEITNPYSVALPVAALDYDLKSSGTSFLSGRAEEQGSIPAKGRGTYPVTVNLPYSGIFEVLSQVKPGGTIPYEAELGVFVDAPAAGLLRLPVRHASELPIPNVPDVSLSNVLWDKVSWERVAAVLYLDVTNTNDWPVDLTELGYQLEIGGLRVGQAGVAQTQSFGSGESHGLRIPLTFSPRGVGLAALRMLTGSSSSTYSLAGALKGQTPFGPIELPFEKSGSTSFSR